MKRLVVMLAVTLLAIGVAHAQSDASRVGAPLDLHPPAVPTHSAPTPARTRTAQNPAPSPSSIFDINPTAGPSQPADDQAVVHTAKAHKHKKPVAHHAVHRRPAAKPAPAPIVHAKATHTKTTHTRLAQIRTPPAEMTYTRTSPATVAHTKTTHTRLTHGKRAPANVADNKIPRDKTPHVSTRARAATVHAKPIHRVAMAHPPLKKPTHHRQTVAADPRGPRGDERQRSDALNDLSARGYADYKDFHRVGDHYVATVNRNGSNVTLTADPRTHQVTTSP